jgi:hypothetical protein
MSWIPENAIVGLDRILNWVQERGEPVWTVYDSDTKDKKTIATNEKQNPPDTLDNAIKRLRVFLSDYENGLVAYLWTKPSQKANSGGFYTVFRIPSFSGSNSTSNNSVGVMAGIGSVEELTTKIKAEIEKDMEQKRILQENTDLKKQLLELQPGTLERVIGRVWETIEPFAPEMAKSIFKKEITGAMVTGTEEEQKLSGSNEEEKAHKLQTALERLYAKDPEIHIKLEKLADLQEKNPGMYNQAISILNSLG